MRATRELEPPEKISSLSELAEEGGGEERAGGEDGADGGDAELERETSGLKLTAPEELEDAIGEDAGVASGDWTGVELAEVGEGKDGLEGGVFVDVEAIEKSRAGFDVEEAA